MEKLDEFIGKIFKVKYNKMKYPFEEKSRTLRLVNSNGTDNIFSKLGIGYIVLATLIGIGSKALNIEYKEILFTVTMVAYIISVSDLLKVSASKWYVQNKIYNNMYYLILEISEFIFSMGLVAIIICPLLFKIKGIETWADIFLVMDICTILTFGIMLITIQKNNYINNMIYKFEKDKRLYDRLDELIVENEKLKEELEKNRRLKIEK